MIAELCALLRLLGEHGACFGWVVSTPERLLPSNSTAVDAAEDSSLGAPTAHKKMACFLAAQKDEMASSCLTVGEGVRPIRVVSFNVGLKALDNTVRTICAFRR
jgi:hypothetical protein